MQMQLTEYRSGNIGKKWNCDKQNQLLYSLLTSTFLPSDLRNKTVIFYIRSHDVK
jgi:hypothetical protein